MEEPKILIGLDYSVASGEVIEILIDDASDPSVFAEIARVNTNRPEILKLLHDHPDTPEEVRTMISGHIQLPVKKTSEIARAERPKEERVRNISQKIQSLSVGERLQLALKGGREIRGILIKDANKQVMMSVLDNQKITESEIELICRSRSVLEEALRKISKNREWMKNYSIVHALVTNPKTPAGISVGLISGLKVKDLVLLEKNRNVPEIVRSAAKRLLSVRKPV